MNRPLTELVQISNQPRRRAKAATQTSHDPRCNFHGPFLPHPSLRGPHDCFDLPELEEDAEEDDVGAGRFLLKAQSSLQEHTALED